MIKSIELNIVKAFEKKYQLDNKLYTDYVISVYNCAKKAVPKGTD